MASHTCLCFKYLVNLVLRTVKLKTIMHVARLGALVPAGSTTATIIGDPVPVVGEGGLEPPRPCEHWHLKPARLPFRHSPEWMVYLTNGASAHQQQQNDHV